MLRHDPVRFGSRVEPMDGENPLFRGMGWESQEKFQDYMSQITRGGELPVWPEMPATSFTRAESGARKYAQGKFTATIRMEPGYKTARDISPIVHKMVAELDDKTSPTDAEVVFIKGTRLVVTKVREIAPGQVQITVREGE